MLVNFFQEESASWMRKAKQNYHAKMHEYRKAREASLKAEGDQQVALQPPKMSNSASSSALGGFYASSSAKVDKKRKQEEELNAKVRLTSTGGPRVTNGIDLRCFEVTNAPHKIYNMIISRSLKWIIVMQSYRIVSCSYFRLNGLRHLHRK